MDVTACLLVLVLTLLLVLYLYIKKAHQYWAKRGIPYPEPLPIFGNTYDIFTLKTTIGFYVLDLYRMFPTEPLVGFYVAEEPSLLIRDPEIIKHVFVKDADHFLDHSIYASKTKDPFSYNMLFPNKSPDWKINRKRLTPAFSTAKIKIMYPGVVESCKKLGKFLDDRLKTNSTVEVRNLCERYLTDMVMSVFFGIRTHCLEDPNAEFMKIPATVFKGNLWLRKLTISYIFIAPRISSLFNLKFIDSFTSGFFKQVLWDALQKREEEKSFRNDILDMLLEMKKKANVTDYNSWDCDKICAQGTMFYIAGYETTSSAVSFGLFELTKNPHCQQRLREELMKLKEKGGGKFDYEEIQKAKYLDMVFKEILRKYPLLHFLDRRCNKDYKVPGHDLVIEKGTVVYASSIGMQHDPKYFPKPEKFDPERFSTKNGADSITPFSYLPFGDGPRYCIGERFGRLSVKLALAHLITEYEFLDSEKTPSTMKFHKGSFLLVPLEGVHLRIEKLKR